MSNLSTFLTGNLVIGTTAGTAKEGNWVPAVSDVTGLSGALAGKVDVSGVKVLSDENYSASEKAKLAGILAGAQVASVAGKTGTVTLVSTDVGGLGALATKSTVAVGDMTASGIPSGTTYLRGDGTWAAAGGGFATGDIIRSLDASTHSLPDWLACDGSYTATASVPSSVRPYLAKAADPTFTISNDPESSGVAGQNVFDSNEWGALVQFSATPYLRFYKKNASGSSYSILTYTTGTPTAAIKCAALQDSGGGDARALLFTAAASSGMFRKVIGGAVSVGAISGEFTGITVVGCAFGADNRWYVLQTTAPYLRSISDPQSGTFRNEGGCDASILGLCISPNKKYMAAWRAAAPYIYVWEYNGSKYVPIGSPVLGTPSNITRLEISDTGVFVGKYSTSVYIGNVVDGVVSNVTTNTGNSGTAWGVMPDGRNFIDWYNNVANYYPITNNTVGTGVALDGYSSGAHGTLYNRPGLTSDGLLFWGASGASYAYALVGEASPEGYMAPTIRNGFLKA